MDNVKKDLRDFMFRGLMFESEASTFQKAGIEIGANISESETEKPGQRTIFSNISGNCSLTRFSLATRFSLLFKKELSEQQLAALFDALRNRGLVRIEGTKVSYDLPTEP